MQHTVYTLLWLLSALNLIFGGHLYSLFQNIIPEKDFGPVGTPIFSGALFIFSLVTILAHQWYIYQSLHDIEKNDQKWKSDFPNWVDTWFEKFLRITAFIVLLIGVGKVPGIEGFCKNHETEIINSQQIMIVFGSCILFLILSIWNLFAGVKSSKWTFFLSDLFALFFWTMIAVVVFGGFLSLSYFAIIPLLIIISYVIVIGKRIAISFKLVKPSNY